MMTNPLKAQKMPPSQLGDLQIHHQAKWPPNQWIMWGKRDGKPLNVGPVIMLMYNG